MIDSSVSPSGIVGGNLAFDLGACLSACSGAPQVLQRY